ncbi:hypothetical protein PENTCL1PPCAC_8521, partial [Pristionchus entomophagus]
INSSLPNAHSNSHFFPLLSMYLKIISGVYVILTTLAFDTIVLRVKVFHPNLRFLLLSFPWCYLGLFLSSFTKDIWEGSFPFDKGTVRFFDSLLLICLVAICLNLFIFVLERIMALIHVNTYESQTTSVLSISLFIFQYGISSILILFIHPLIAILLIFISVIASGIILLKLPSISTSDHDKHLAISHGNISTRYQSVENLKAARLLRNLFIYLIPAEPLIPILFLFINITLPKAHRDPFFDLLHVFIAFHLSIALVIVIRCNDSYSSQFRRLIGKGEKKRGSVQSVTGKSLNIHQSLHSNTYFQMFNQSW